MNTKQRGGPVVLQPERSSVLLVLWEELPEPRLHDEPGPVKMSEVVLQSGNVRLETGDPVSPGCAENVRRTCGVSGAYLGPSDAFKLRLRQVCNQERGGSRSAEQHLVMRRLLCLGVLRVEFQHRELRLFQNLRPGHAGGGRTKVLTSELENIRSTHSGGARSSASQLTTTPTM